MDTSISDTVNTSEQDSVSIHNKAVQKSSEFNQNVQHNEKAVRIDKGVTIPLNELSSIIMTALESGEIFVVTSSEKKTNNQIEFLQQKFAFKYPQKLFLELPTYLQDFIVRNTTKTVTPETICDIIGIKINTLNPISVNDDLISQLVNCYTRLQELRSDKKSLLTTQIRKGLKLNLNSPKSRLDHWLPYFEDTQSINA